MACSKCILSKTCRYVQIEGRGSSRPEVMFVGQAPGREEDLRGKCFVGPAGQLLTQAITEYSLKPAYITNLVKCFPPQDRDPQAPEIEACKPYLMEEIKELEPKIIVLLGNIPLKAVLGLTKITELSGKLIVRDGQKYFPLLHPSFILRYPHNQAMFENHLKELRRLIKGEEKSKVETEQATVKDAKRLLKASDEIAFDYETTGIEEHSAGKIRCLGISDGDKALWVDAQEPGFSTLARDMLGSGLVKIAQSSNFERRVSKENLGVYPVNLKWDTLAMHFLLDENSMHNLDVLAGKYLDAPNWDIYDEMVQSGHTYATFPMKKLGPYCATDAFYTFKLYKIFRAELEKDPKLMWVYENILLPLSEVTAKLDIVGTHIDMKWNKRLEVIMKREMDQLQWEFRSMNKQKLYKLGLFQELNMNSRDQMRKFFVKGLGFNITEKTDGGQASIKQDVMEKFRNKHASVPVYLDWVSRFTLLNNFIQKYQNFVDKKDIIHASFNPFLVVSGRLSVTKPPLQAVATEPRIRGMFNSRFDGGSIASCDFKQLELRLIASEAKEENLLKVFRDGGDPHTTTAKRLFGDKFTKFDRDKAKRCNFGVAYDVSGYTLAKEFNMSEREGDNLIAEWYRSYPAIETWKETRRVFVRNKGYIRSRFGRMRRLGKTDNLPTWQARAIERQAGNFPIQSAGADITNLALIRLFEVFHELNLESRIFLQVHDSILVDVCPGEEKQVELAMKETMTGVQKMCPWLNVKLEVDFKLSSRWEGLKWKDLKEASHG